VTRGTRPARGAAGHRSDLRFNTVSPQDPYAVLGVSPQASEAEIRSAYRHAVQREHPDHNGGSPEAARRFEAVQEAYAAIRVRQARSETQSGQASPDPGLDARLADLERELSDLRAAREKARRAAREAEAQARARAGSQQHRPTDEELGYIKTDDSFTKILSDAASGLLSDAREQRVPERLADLLDELGTKLHRKD
jgi:curved DNA-binding protein CbpA